MALRVLLADESSTIKKVMQLALQDFAVEVKSVPVGLDVLSVSKIFKPDIVFADVLLTKRNGYEVCGDLKNDPATAHIPVVLMWSGFMEIDEAKANECRANRRLEKPFDADTLRHIVNELVPKTISNPLSEYLTFPTMPDFADEPANQAVDEVSAAEINIDTGNFEPDATVIAETNFDGPAGLDNIYAIPEANDELGMPQGEEFSQVPLTATPKDDSIDEGGWTRQDLSKFKIQLPAEEPVDLDGAIEMDGSFASKFVIPSDEAPAGLEMSGLEPAGLESSGMYEEINFEEHRKQRQPSPAMPKVKDEKANAPRASNISAPATPAQAPRASQQNIKDDSVKAQSKVDMSPDMLEKILREQSREVIESICWKILPDIAERIVREELQKILRDNER